MVVYYSYIKLKKKKVVILCWWDIPWPTVAKTQDSVSLLSFPQYEFLYHGLWWLLKIHQSSLHSSSTKERAIPFPALKGAILEVPHDTSTYSSLIRTQTSLATRDAGKNSFFQASVCLSRTLLLWEMAGDQRSLPVDILFKKFLLQFDNCP